MSGGGSGGGDTPSSTTSNNTETVINQAPDYEQQYISNLLGQAATTAAQPYQQFPGQQVADLTPDQLSAFSQIEGLEGNGTGGTAATQGAAANNLATAGSDTANSIYSSGSPYFSQAATYNPAAAASPYLQASAATNTPQGISAFMSPFLNNDITGLQNTAEQTWNQFTAPSVNNSFISAGQAGSGRNEQVLGQQANLADQSLEGQIASAENSAYSTAGTQAANAASNLGNLGSTAGSTTASEAANLQGIGTGLGNLASTQAGAQGNAAANLANTASTVQNTGVTGAAALQSVGQQQQTQNQSNINTAVSNFNAQNLWPETQESFLNSIINGLPSPGSSTTGAGQSPTTTNDIGSVSPLSSLAGTLIGASGVTGKKKGGLIKGYAAGGSVGDDPMPPTPMDISAQLSAGNGATDIPQVSAADLSPLAHISNDNAPSSTPLPMSDGENQSSNPLRTIDPQSPESSSEGRNLQLLSLARGLLTPSHSNAESVGNGIGDYIKTSMDMPNYQMQQLALQKQQAIQPLQIASMQQAYGQNPQGSGSGSPSASSPTQGAGQTSTSDQQFSQAYRLALMSGDMKTAANVLQSWAEHNPQLAGQIKASQEQNTYQKTPQGTFVMPNGAGSDQSVQNPQTPTVSPLQTNPNNSQLLASDGKPIVPNVQNISHFKPDPSGIPAYNGIPNTETGVALQKGLQDEDLKANSEMTSNLSSLQKEQYRLQQMANVYQQTQSGTLLAQNPDTAKQLVAWGVISNPSQIHDLSMVQKGLANQAIQIIQQTKDANANLGGSPTRLFGSEISNMQQKAENPSATPEANYEVITDAMGLANHSADMAKGWDTIGGLGNRLANGSTLRPADYARQFIETHDPQDYKTAAMRSLGKFKGMAPSTSSNQNGSDGTKNYVRINGTLVAQ